MKRLHPENQDDRRKAQELVNAVKMTAPSEARAIAWGLLSELNELRKMRDDAELARVESEPMGPQEMAAEDVKEAEAEAEAPKPRGRKR